MLYSLNANTPAATSDQRLLFPGSQGIGCWQKTCADAAADGGAELMMAVG